MLIRWPSTDPEDALYRWNRTMGFKEPPPLDMAQDLTHIAKTLQEPHYVLHDDSLAGVDLSPEVEANRIRSVTQALRSSRLVVSAMRHYRQYWALGTATRYQLLRKCAPPREQASEQSNPPMN